MDRVETLILKLQEQFKNGATATQLMLTVQMLQHELNHLQAASPAVTSLVAVSMPPVSIAEAVAENKTALPATTMPPAPAEEEKIIEVLQVDEAAVEAELEEIKRNAAAIQQITTKSRPQLLFDMADDDIPTLPPKPAPVPAPPAKEINDMVAKEATSLNDLHKEKKPELGDKLVDTPVKDLKKAIGVNDRFLYIKELFRGDEAMYERSIKTINSFSIWPEAEYWIRRELKTKLGWVDTEPVVIQFDQLVKRRFA
ncbi:MAG: hypothetical protein QM791_15885 [Ferruginibacter sp.]